MKIVIIEDEPQIAEELKDLVERINPGVEVIGLFGSIERSVEFLSVRNNEPDLIFMDIQLSDGLSFEIFERVRINCPVVFCTAYDQYTMRAFKTNGVEYILKPIREEEIGAAFNKVEKLKQSFNADETLITVIKSAISGSKSYRSTILVQFKASYIPISIDHIAFFCLSNEVVYAHCFDGKKYSVFKSMEEIESTLNPAQFYRINRQILLNRSAIREIQSYVNRKVIVKPVVQAMEMLIVSRLKVSTFLRWIEQP